MIVLWIESQQKSSDINVTTGFLRVDSTNNLKRTNYFTLNGKLLKNGCDKTI